MEIFGHIVFSGQHASMLQFPFNITGLFAVMEQNVDSICFVLRLSLARQSFFFFFFFFTDNMTVGPHWREEKWQTVWERRDGSVEWKQRFSTLERWCTHSVLLCGKWSQWSQAEFLPCPIRAGSRTVEWFLHSTHFLHLYFAAASFF